LTVGDAQAAVAVSIDLLDEEHSLQLALERLVTDAPLRRRLGAASRAWWRAHHQLAPMADAYVGVIAAALATPAPDPRLPPHLTADGTEQASRLATELGVQEMAAKLFS
jgi:hypothetical protein